MTVTQVAGIIIGLSLGYVASHQLPPSVTAGECAVPQLDSVLKQQLEVRLAEMVAERRKLSDELSRIVADATVRFESLEKSATAQEKLLVPSPLLTTSINLMYKTPMQRWLVKTEEELSKIKDAVAPRCAGLNAR